MVVKIILGSTICFAAMAQSPDPSDPVLKAKAIRALENGKDLPPIPRGLIEPPPLPPPELHSHDIRKSRGGTAKTKRPVAKSSTGSAQKSQAGAARPATKSAAPSQQKTKQGATKTTSSAKPSSSAQKSKIGAAK
ncbi:MAG: hypothetical protein LBC63_10545 [Holophagales bacterium]|jgi:type IV secretory pathway VirB10-like protein|nr:hypothetical protein [Holophagales bacterium]